MIFPKQTMIYPEKYFENFENIIEGEMLIYRYYDSYPINNVSYGKICEPIYIETIKAKKLFLSTKNCRIFSKGAAYRNFIDSYEIIDGYDIDDYDIENNYCLFYSEVNFLNLSGMNKNDLTCVIDETIIIFENKKDFVEYKLKF